MMDKDMDSNPLDYVVFLVGLGKLIANYPPRADSQARADALLALWWEILSGKEWLTVDVFDRAVTWTAEHVTDYLPSVGKFLEVCQMLRPKEVPKVLTDEQPYNPPPPHIRAALERFRSRGMASEGDCGA